MSIDYTKAAIAVMQAYIDGKGVEVKHRCESRWGHCIIRPPWNWEQCEYRIKPEPREYWIDEERHRVFVAPPPHGGLIHVREILE